MSALEEALDVLRDVATGGPRQRAVALARGARLFADLTSDEKRELAVRVAEKAAPHLVPVIQAETGMELSPQQISAVLQMASQLDEEQVDELRAALLDGDVRSGLAAGLATDLASDLGFEIPDDLSGLDPDLAPPVGSAPDAQLPSPPPPASSVDIGLDELDAGVASDPLEHEPHELDLEPLPSSPLATGSLAAAVAEVVPDADPPEPEAVAIVVEVDDPEPLHVVTVTGDDEPVAGVPDPDTGMPEPVDARALLTDLRTATSPRARTGRLRTASTDELWRIGATARLAVLRSFPDGWERRRAIHRLLEVDVVSADEAVAVARTVIDTASRRWVVGSLSEAGLLDDDQVRSLVSAGTADRIGARRGG